MITTKILEEMMDRVRAAVAATTLSSDHSESLKQSIHDIVKVGLAKFELVGREEFDIQRKVLARTRERLAALEAQLAALTKSSAS